MFHPSDKSQFMINPALLLPDTNLCLACAKVVTHDTLWRHEDCKELIGMAYKFAMFYRKRSEPWFSLVIEASGDPEIGTFRIVRVFDSEGAVARILGEEDKS
jgi:hypothetical protein